MSPEDMAEIYAAAFSDTRPWTLEEIRNLLGSRSIFAVTAEHGFAMGRVIAGEVELLTLAVHPNAQRQGVGHALLNDFLTRAIRLGGDTFFLEVAEDNHSAIGLYTRAGFVPNGRRKAYYKRTDGAVDAVVMSKVIRPDATAAI